MAIEPMEVVAAAAAVWQLPDDALKSWWRSSAVLAVGTFQFDLASIGVTARRSYRIDAAACTYLD